MLLMLINEIPALLPGTKDGKGLKGF